MRTSMLFSVLDRDPIWIKITCPTSFILMQHYTNLMDKKLSFYYHDDSGIQINR